MAVPQLTTFNSFVTHKQKRMMSCQPSAADEAGIGGKNVPCSEMILGNI